MVFNKSEFLELYNKEEIPSHVPIESLDGVLLLEILIWRRR